MSSESAPASSRVSLKGLAKYLSKFYPVSVDDISNPKPEKTMDIMWNICCHLYGEDHLLSCLRGKEKRFGFAIVLRSLFDRLIPSQTDGYTLKDLVYPTKERLVPFYVAFMQLTKVYDAQMHTKDRVHAEIATSKNRMQLLQDSIVRTTERVHIAQEKREQTIKRCNELKDKFLTLETRCKQANIQVAEYHGQMEKAKVLIAEQQAKEVDLRTAIKIQEEKIHYQELNSLPPKGELEEKLRNLKSEVEQKQAQRDHCVASTAALADKMQSIAKNKSICANVLSLLTETLQLSHKNREKMAECEEAKKYLEKAIREVMLPTKEMERETTLHTKSMKAEKELVGQRIADAEEELGRFQVVEDDMADIVSAHMKNIEKLAEQMEAIKFEEQQVKVKFDETLETERKSRAHLQYLQE